MAERPNPAVSSSLLQEIWNWKQKGVSMTDIVSRLRTRTVPSGYPYHTWKPGKYSIHKQALFSGHTYDDFLNSCYYGV